MIFWKCKKKKERFLWWVILGVGLDDWMQFIQYKNHCTFPLNMKTQHVCVHVFVCVRFPGCQGGADMGHIICGVISRARHSSSSVFLKQTGYTSKKGNTLACQPCVCVCLCVCNLTCSHLIHTCHRWRDYPAVIEGFCVDGYFNTLR